MAMRPVTQYTERAMVWAALFALAFASGCEDSVGARPGSDGPAPAEDGPPGDMRPVDAGPRLDAEPVIDRGSVDSAPLDAIPLDTRPPDAMPPDAMPPDAIPPDAMPPDAIPPDAIPPDAIPPDAMPPDALTRDGLPPDLDPCDGDPTLGMPCAVGLGACAADGLFVCVAGQTVCDAQPGEPSPEVCDAIDDDCDGAVDEDIAEEPCALGEGTCRAEGRMACLGGELRCDAEPGEPAPRDDCDGLDNDCNGVVDDLVAAQVPCGLAVGACRRAGVLFCNAAGQRRCDAVPGEPSPEICDGIDNDCDNEADEDTDFAADLLHCGACDVACPGPCPRCELARCTPCGTGDDCGSAAACRLADGACVEHGQLYVKDPAGFVDGAFGGAVDLDGGRLAVGQSGDPGDAQSALEARNANLPGAGAVHVLQRGDGGWIGRYLKADEPAEDALFGHAVALRGDVLAVGAPGRGFVHPGDGLLHGEGEAHVFEARGDGWVHAARFRRVLGHGHALGGAVAIGGGRVFVGDWGEPGDTDATLDAPNTRLFTAGAVFVLERQADGGWSPSAMIKPRNLDLGDRFGFAVAASARWLVVGAPDEDGDGASIPEAPNDDAPGSGAVYVFERTAQGEWARRAYLKAIEVAGRQQLGASVDVSGDRIAAAARTEVHVFDRAADGTWTPSARIGPPPQRPWFAVSALALRGDRLVVGTRDDPSAPGCDATDRSVRRSGAVFVFDRQPDGRWIEVARLKAQNAGEGDWLGHAVALDAQWVVAGAHYEAGDGASTLAAPNDDAEGAGAVYVFEGLPATHCGPDAAAGADELCDGADNDCDGEIDEGPDGGARVEACFAGHIDAVDVGICVAGQRVCVAGEWGPCEGQRLPEAEVCDVVDNDCDRRLNEGCVVLDRDGDGVSPFQGDCDDADPAVLPGADDGCDGIDNDCDGVVDEGGPPPLPAPCGP